MEGSGADFSALNLLSELSKEKQIAPDKALYLKNAFVKLHTVCAQSQQSEKGLLEAASKLNDDIKIKKELLEGQGQLQAHDRGHELRQEMLKASNELAMSASRDMELQGEVGRLLEERRVLHDELMEIQQPAAVAADSEITRLKTAVTQAQQELTQRASELELLRTQRDQRLKRVNEAVQQREHCERLLATVRGELAGVQGEPQRVAKQSDALLLTHAALKAKIDEAESLQRELGREDESAARRRKETHAALDQVRLDMERARRDLDELQHDAQQHAAQIEMNSTTYTDHIGQRAVLEAEVKRVKKELKIAYEQSMRLAREKDRGIKALRVLAATCDKLDGNVDATASARHDLAMQLEARKREANDLAAIVPGVKREVTELTKTLDTQGLFGAETGRAVREGLEVQVVLEGELAQAQKDLADSSWRLRSVQTALVQAQNEVVRAQASTERNHSTLALKQQALADCMAQLQQLQRSLVDTEVVYQVVKTDNNKVSSQIGAVAQREAEMGEKIKVLQSEIEILRASVLEKDSKLSRQITTNAVSVTARDALRAEGGVVRLKADDLLTQKKGKFGDNKNLLDVLASVEETSARLSQEFAAVQAEKEDLGERVHECQGDLASLYDKLHAVAAHGRTADVALQAREDELRFLRIEAVELKRAIESLRARLPEKEKLQQGLLLARMDLLSEQKQATRLEASLTDPSNTARWRQLGGSDPSAEDMVKKIEDLERRLAQKEATALERELVLGETSKLVDRAKKQVEGGRGDTVTVAKAVQDYQARLRDTNRKIMALIAEVSMYQANTLQLQQQVHEKQLDVEEANERLQRGEAPTEEALHEWEREVRREHQAMLEATQRTAEQDAATLRPNAYLPDAEGELPIARPYGPYAPFKPSEPANNMRHIRKAMVRPVKT